MAKSFLVILFLFVCTTVHGQYDRLSDPASDRTSIPQHKGFLESYGAKMLFAVDGKDEKLSNPIVYGALGYSFNKNISLSGIMDIGYALFKDYKDSSDKSLGKERNYKIYSAVGVLLGINALSVGRDVVECNVSLGNTIFSEWHHFYIDAGVHYHINPRVKTLTPYITGGARFLKSHSSRFDNHFGLYIGLGVRIND